MLDFFPHLNYLGASLIQISKPDDSFQIIHAIRFDMSRLIAYGLTAICTRFMLNIHLLIVQWY